MSITQRFYIGNGLVTFAGVYSIVVGILNLTFHLDIAWVLPALIPLFIGGYLEFSALLRSWREMIRKDREFREQMGWTNKK